MKWKTHRSTQNLMYVAIPDEHIEEFFAAFDRTVKTSMSDYITLGGFKAKFRSELNNLGAHQSSA